MNKNPLSADNTHSLFIPLNGHREVIESMQSVVDTLISEGWLLVNDACYPDNMGNPNRDYLVKTFYREFKTNEEKSQ